MPIENGDYIELTQAEIEDALETELQNEFGANIDLTESSVFSTLVRVLATVLQNNQEQSIAEVYQNAFLDTATGEALDDVVSIIGIARRAATHATGVERFTASNPVTQDYIIPGGTVVQTGGSEPVEFETTEVTTLELIDSFEDGNISEYTGSTASASVVADGDAPNGSNVLELDATSGAHIWNENITVQRGTTFHAWLNPEQASTVPIQTFAVQQGDTDTYYQIAVDHSADEARVEYVLNGSVDTTIATASSLGLSTDTYYEVETDWDITGNIAITVYDETDTEIGSASGTDTNLISGYPGFKSGDALGTKRFDWYTTSAVSANIRAIMGGDSGNVGAQSITNLPSPPAGVDTVTNLYPTGDNTYTDTNGDSFILGKDEETDDELRERAQDAVTGGGSATHDAIASELINDTAGVKSVSIIENKTDTDNTGSGGLPPHSFEAVVFGGTDQDVAETIFEKKAVTARDYGGVNGSLVSVQVTSDVNGDVRTIDFTRPTEINVDMTLDLVVDEDYVGNDALRDDIVRYIGGTLSDDSDAVGLGVAEDVLIDRIQDAVVGPDNGVVGLDQSVDGTPISTTPSITTVDGLRVVDIGANEVAQTDATDGSITLNTRTI